MKATFRLVDTHQIEATMTITMPVQDWKKLREELSSGYPSLTFGSHIAHLIDKAEGVIESEESRP